MYPDGDFRNGPRESVLDIKSDVMVSYLHQQQLEKMWASGAAGEGVILKKSKGNYTCFPTQLENDPGGLFEAVKKMNVKCAMTVSTRVIQIFLARQESEYVPLSEDLRLQVLPSVDYLPRCQKHHFGAFIQNLQILLVWDDQAKHVLDRAEYFEKSLMEMIWAEGEEEIFDEKKNDVQVGSEEVNGKKDLESAAPPRRMTMLINPIMVGLTLALLFSALGLGWRNLGLEVAADGKLYRLALLAVTPCQIFVSLFFMQIIVVNLCQLMGPTRQARREFYEEHSIGWVARPKHNPNPAEGDRAFLRRGKFKKASNMNYALMISNKVEDRLVGIERGPNWSQEDEDRCYQDALAAVTAAEEGRAWADGNIRIGDYILLIDSDTRVPADCLLDAASEMEQSPEVGILQYSSGVMTVTNSFFERGVTFFTNLIYTAIKYTVANGDVSPFVGHNAILRWSAIQEVSYTDDDGYEKFWSESHVSEDFDMSLRLQIAKYTIRLGAYTGDGFKEGVSLTVYDELARWEKYAYGCNELLFHPFRLWLTRGPFTPLFRKFIFSPIRLTSKITIMAYIGTYYAIGAAWILTLANYFIMGWYNGMYDKYYLDSFKVYFSLILVFSLLGNISLAILRYRIEEDTLYHALYTNFRWLFLLTIFLGGISMHVSQSLLCHFFEIDMSWGATAKEVENTTFFKELPRLGKRFFWTFAFCIACALMIVTLALWVPWNWRITDFVAIYPLCTVIVSHFMLPIVLNPALMMFTF
ncbi:glycosyltransferase family 2 protein [Rutstroemia sp. NJR-2017a BBW]|nr:glycosyltransferase family 2 protein [Rutstroemia sp. NJR-2017a BBW]